MCQHPVEYTDPRLVALYDALNPYAADTAFYLALAAAHPGAAVLDIGCGTGLLACELAARGHEVTAVDPAAPMLDVARTRPGAEAVRWVHGTGGDAEAASADLAVMTGHVAQVFLDDADWEAALAAAHRALRPGGRLAFESRNPAVAPWRGWTPQASRREVPDVDGSPVVVWTQLLEEGAGRVAFENHYRFARSGRELVSTSLLRFRDRRELVASVEAAGFAVTDVLGDWDGRPATDTSRELIVVAQRR